MADSRGPSPSLAASALGSSTYSRPGAFIAPARRSASAPKPKNMSARTGAANGAAGILGHHHALHRIGPIGGDIERRAQGMNALIHRHAGQWA